MTTHPVTWARCQLASALVRLAHPGELVTVLPSVMQGRFTATDRSQRVTRPTSIIKSVGLE